MVSSPHCSALSPASDGPDGASRRTTPAHLRRLAATPARPGLQTAARLSTVAGPKHRTQTMANRPGPPRCAQPLSFSALAGRQLFARLSLGRNIALAFTQARWDVNIWRVGVAGGSRTDEAALSHGSPLLCWITCRNFSSDGGKIAFASYRSGTPEIWVCDSNGQNFVPVDFL